MSLDGQQLLSFIQQDDLNSIKTIIHQYPPNYRFRNASNNSYALNRSNLNSSNSPYTPQYPLTNGYNIAAVCIFFGRSRILDYILSLGFKNNNFKKGMSDMSFILQYGNNGRIGLVINWENILSILNKWSYDWNRLRNSRQHHYILTSPIVDLFLYYKRFEITYNSFNNIQQLFRSLLEYACPYCETTYVNSNNGISKMELDKFIGDIFEESEHIDFIIEILNQAKEKYNTAILERTLLTILLDELS